MGIVALQGTDFQLQEKLIDGPEEAANIFGQQERDDKKRQRMLCEADATRWAGM